MNQSIMNLCITTSLGLTSTTRKSTLMDSCQLTSTCTSCRSKVLHNCLISVRKIDLTGSATTKSIEHPWCPTSPSQDLSSRRMPFVRRSFLFLALLLMDLMNSSLASLKSHRCHGSQHRSEASLSKTVEDFSSLTLLSGSESMRME